MATREWHLIATGPGSEWSKLYDRYFEARLTARELRYYRSVRFDFDPSVHIQEEAFTAIQQDSAFLQGWFSTAKPITDKMLQAMTAQIKETVNRKRRPSESSSRHAASRPGAGRRAQQSREAEENERRTEKLLRLEKELLFLMMACEGELQPAAERTLAAWRRLPDDVKKIDRSKTVSKVKISVGVVGAVAGAGLATASLALVPVAAPAIVAFAAAWYGVVRSIAGGTQQWKLLNRDTESLLKTTMGEIEDLRKKSKPRTRALAAGVAKGLTGREVMNQVGRFEGHVRMLESHLPKIKLSESKLGPAINDLLDLLENSTQRLQEYEAYILGGENLHDQIGPTWRHFKAEVMRIEKQVKQFVKTPGVQSDPLQNWIKEAKTGAQKLRTDQGKTPQLIETITGTLIGVGLSTVTAASTGTFNLTDLCGAAQAASACDISGLTIGAMADLEATVGALEESLGE